MKMPSIAIPVNPGLAQLINVKNRVASGIGKVVDVIIQRRCGLCEKRAADRI